ncbi:MAG: hypothetical protein ACP5FK_10465 [bacterium]
MNKKRKSILIISFSNHEKDIRIIRHKNFFKNNNFLVNSISIKDVKKDRFNLFNKIKFLLYQFISIEKAVEIIHGKYKGKINRQYDVIQCNDWRTLPLGYKFLLNCKKAFFIYDSHELAVKEYNHSLKWNVFFRFLIYRIENKYLKFVNLISTVENNIALELSYRVGKKIIVVRNIPFISDGLDIKKKAEKFINFPIKIYHHGGYMAGRNIEEFINAVILFPEKFQLYLRLTGNIKSLKEKYIKYKNIIFLDPVKPEEVLYTCFNYDIGFPIIEPVTGNWKFALPNKFFENICSGLPVIVTKKNISMFNYVDQYNIGFIADNYKINSFIELLSSITLDEVKQITDNLQHYKGKLSGINEWSRYLKYINYE